MSYFNGEFTPEFCDYVDKWGSGSAVDAAHHLQHGSSQQKYDIDDNAYQSLNTLWVEYQGAQARGEVT